MRRREDGEVRRRAQVGTNAWRTGEGVMADRRISKTKGQGHDHLCDTAGLYGTETLALTEL